MTGKENKKIVYIDMDNVIVDFQTGIDELQELRPADYAAHINAELDPDHDDFYQDMDEVDGIFA